MTVRLIPRVKRLWSRAQRVLCGSDGDITTEPGFAMRTRVVLAAGIMLLSGTLCFLLLSINIEERWAGDFTWALRGAEYLLSGENPYQQDGYPKEDPLFYPLPALFIAIPFTPFAPELAGALFFGFSSGLLAFAAARHRYTFLPLFISAPFFMAMLLAQWAPLIMMAVFVPALLVLAFMKPSLGAAIAVSWPNRWVIPVGAALGLLSLVILPTWPLDWLGNLGAHSHPIALLIFPGPLVLLALLCWRRRDARFLLLLALIPQRLLFYDQLLLWLVTRSAQQGIFLAVASWIGFFGWTVTSDITEKFAAESWVVWSVFLPATVIVLWNGRSEFYGELAQRWRFLNRSSAARNQAERELCQ